MNFPAKIFKNKLNFHTHLSILSFGAKIQIQVSDLIFLSAWWWECQGTSLKLGGHGREFFRDDRKDQIWPLVRISLLMMTPTLSPPSALMRGRHYYRFWPRPLQYTKRNFCALWNPRGQCRQFPILILRKLSKKKPYIFGVKIQIEN